jgi:hypothetical protein
MELIGILLFVFAMRIDKLRKKRQPSRQKESKNKYYKYTDFSNRMTANLTRGNITKNRSLPTSNTMTSVAALYTGKQSRLQNKISLINNLRSIG